MAEGRSASVRREWASSLAPQSPPGGASRPDGRVGRALPILSPTLLLLAAVTLQSAEGLEIWASLLFHLYHNYGDVVLPSGAVGRLHQRITRFLRAARGCDDVLDFVVQHHLPQSV